MAILICRSIVPSPRATSRHGLPDTSSSLWFSGPIILFSGVALRKGNQTWPHSFCWRADRKHVGRGYPEAKIQENVQAEIMEVIAAEARESYDSSVIMEVQHDSPEQMESALETIAGWVQQCRSM